MWGAVNIIKNLYYLFLHCLAMKTITKLILSFTFLLVLAILMPDARGEMAATLNGPEIHADSQAELNLTLIPDNSEDITVSVYLGREDYGTQIEAFNATAEAGKNISANLSFTPLFGENHLFVYVRNSTSMQVFYFPLLAGADYSDVLLIINNNSADSREIGEHFLLYHNPHVFYLDAPVKETINNDEFEECRRQIEDFLQNNSLTDKLNYIVTTKGVPLRVYRGSGGDSGTNAAFDSELTLILGTHSSSIGGAGYASNPYYGQERPFNREKYGIYLVTRLTGYTVKDAEGIIDRAVNASSVDGGRNLSKGRIILDVDPGKDGSPGYKVGNDWLRNAANTTSGRGYSPYLDTNNTFVSYQNNVSLYASWGSNDGHDFFAHGTNTGMEADENSDGVPDDWAFLFGEGIMNRTEEDVHGGRWSVRVFHNTSSSESALLQNFTPEVGKRYYLRGYANLSEVSGSGGVSLTIRYYDASHHLIKTVNGAVRRGTTSDWVSCSNCILEPVEGADHVRFGAVFYNATGTVYLDDIQLVEIVPHNSYIDGAIVETFVSTSARSFHYPTNYGQSLIADMIRSGTTGAKGYCFEPYLDAIAHPDILFDRYTAGYNLAESYYAASIKLSWMDVVVGDPKLAPYAFFPDPEIREMTIIPSPSNSMNLTIGITLSNSGGSASLPSNLTLSISNGTTFWNQSLSMPALYPGEGITLTLNWSAPSPDSYTADAALNYAGYEKERSNNRFGKGFDVLTPPDFSFTGHWISPETPIKDENFTLRIDVENSGETGVEKVNLTLYNEGKYLASRLLTLSGLESRHPEFTLSLSPGTHHLTVLIDPDDSVREGNESNNRLDFEIFVDAMPVAVAGENITTRAGLPAVFNASGSYDPDGNITFYSWNFLGKDWPGKVVTAYFYTRGNHTVTLTVTDNNGATNSSSIVVFVENTPPVASTVFPAEVMSLEPVSFDARLSRDNDSTPLNYLWDFGDGTNSSAKYVTHVYKRPGNYTVALTVTDDVGAGDTITRTIVVKNRLPEIALVVQYRNSSFTPQTVNSVLFSAGEHIAFNLSGTSDPDGSIFSFHVDFGDGNTADFPADTMEFSHTYSTPGNFTMNLTAADDEQGRSWITLTIHIRPSPLNVVILVSPAEPTTFELVHLTATTSGGFGIMNFTWSVDGSEHYEQNITQIFESYGNHYITLTVTDETGQSAVQSRTLIVGDSPPAVEDGTITCRTGEKVRLHWNVTDRDGGINYYLVTFPDGTQEQTDSAFLFHTFHSPGSYVLNITAVDDMGLSGSGNLTVTVEKGEGGKGGFIPGFEAAFFVGALGAAVVLFKRYRNKTD